LTPKWQVDRNSLDLEGINLAKAKAKKQARRRPGRPPNEGPSYDVLALRKKIGKLNGVPQISRDTLAKLLEAAVGSIVNWERGMAPRTSYLVKLRDLQRQAEAGTLKITVPRRGRQPSAAKRGPGRPPRTASAVALGREPSNVVPVLYANHARVEKDSRGARIRFALVLPGGRGDARAVADLVVPLEVIASLQ
jgi:hypothetical protein